MNRTASGRTRGLRVAFYFSVLCIGAFSVGDVRADDRKVHTSRQGARALPLAKEDGVFHFAIFADRTGGPAEGIRVLAQAVEDTNLLDPDLVLTVGDLIEGYNTTEPWMRQMKEFRDTMNGLKMPWFPVAGNHDIYWRGDDKPPGEHEASYEKHFGPLWYWFEHKNSAFVVLYTDEGDPKTGRKSFNEPETTQMSATQINWLRSSLKEMRHLKHVFVFLHHPRWIQQRYKGSNWPEVHRVLAEAGNVRAVFAGHIHRLHYAGVQDGIEYFSLATTGGHRGRDFLDGGWAHHLNVVTVREDGFEVAGIPVGAVFDTRQFTQERWSEIDALMRLRPTLASGPLLIKASGEGFGSFRCQINNPTKQPIEVTVSEKRSDGSWYFGPDHQHLKLDPGATSEVEIGYVRRADGLDAYADPVLRVETDYLLGGRRIAIPARDLALPVALSSVSGSFWNGLSNQAVHLDGAGDCVRVSSSALAVPDGPFTLEGWLYAEDPKKGQAVVAKTQNSEYSIFLEKGIVSFSVHLDGSYARAESAQGVVKAKTWHHFAGVFDGRELVVFVDGIPGARVAASGRRTPNALPLYIGADPNERGDPVSFFKGRIDEVRLSTKARYVGPFTPQTQLDRDDATVLLHKLDGRIGPFVPVPGDRAGHGRLLGNARLQKR